MRDKVAHYLWQATHATQGYDCRAGVGSMANGRLAAAAGAIIELRLAGLSGTGELFPIYYAGSADWLMSARRHGGRRFAVL